MGDFTYTALNAASARSEGTIEAADKKDAANKIRRLGLTPIDIKERGSPARSKIAGVLFDRVQPEDLLMVYVQLHDMMSAGINLLTCLESLEDQTHNGKLKSILRDVGERIRQGKSFSDALEQHRDVFPELLISMMKGGESSGKMDVVLDSYARLYEEQLDLKQKVMTALFYPLILLAMGVLVIVFLVTFIIPKFVTIFTDAGVALPLPTKILYAAGTLLTHYWYLFLIGGILAALGIRRYVRTRAGRIQLDTIKLMLPIAGPLFRNVAVSRFSITLGMLLRSGVPIMRALELTRGVMENVVMENAISGVTRGLERGEGLAVMMMRAEGVFPPNIIQMVSVGEETGNLDGMLEKAGILYDKAIANAIKKMTIVIEPLFLVVIGSAVGFIMASILLPLFSMINAVKM